VKVLLILFASFLVKSQRVIDRSRMAKKSKFISGLLIGLAFLMPIKCLAEGDGDIPQVSWHQFWNEMIPPCLVVSVTDSLGHSFDILKCPVTGKYYKAHDWTEFDVYGSHFQAFALTGKIIDGIVKSDMIGFVSVTVKQGKVTFGYPFDYRFAKSNVVDNDSNNFLNQPIMRDVFDGDFVSYISNGTNFSVWATFATKDNKLHWHDAESFEVLECAPLPDPDADFLYYRMQDTNTCVKITGGLHAKNSGYLPFAKYGVEGVRDRLNSTEILREVDWSNNLLGGVQKWVKEYKKTSIRDPRKFYVRLKSGERAFAMIQDDKRKLYSPIAHAKLAVSRDEIVGFEPIDDKAYPEHDCYSKNEVEELWECFSGDRSWLDSSLAAICGEHYIPGHPVKSLWDRAWYALIFIYWLGLVIKKTRRCFAIPLLAIKYVVRVCIWQWILRPLAKVVGLKGK